LRVLFAGRFDANQKGLDWLCDCLRARADEWRGQFSFTFMGQGKFRPQLMRLSSELGYVHVAVRPWGDVRRAMTHADVLLLPSRFEGVPLVALEAAHYGLPVVASKDAGVSDLLPPWCLFDFGDDAVLWAAMKVLRDPARRAAALAFSRDRMRQMLSPESFHQGIRRIVAELARLSRAGVDRA
jgi:glycosyltransferase involved in cell wall biosynthesis